MNPKDLILRRPRQRASKDDPVPANRPSRLRFASTSGGPDVDIQIVKQGNTPV